MEQHIFIGIVLGVLGLVWGSFAGATVWRLRARQLKADAGHGEKISATEKKQIAKLHKRPPHKDRSVCLHCGHTLKWYDLIPLVSWISLKGKCRYCHKSIGWFEPVMELGLAAFFVASYTFWATPLTTTFDIIQLAIWLVAGTALAILFAYDAKWYLLPNVVVFPLIGIGVINAALVIIEGGFMLATIGNVLLSCAVLGGLYYVLYIASHHQWVGFGDVKLGLALGLLLADWQLAILALFLANLIGTVIFLPFLMSGRLNRKAHIPFGPLLIAGYVVAGLFGTQILSWYTAFTLGV